MDEPPETEEKARDESTRRGRFGFLAEYDTSGNHLWSEAYGVGVANVNVAAVAQGSNESAFIAGRLRGTIRLGDDEISSGDDYVVFLHRIITP